MEVEYMTLLQRDLDNYNEGLEEGELKGELKGEKKVLTLMSILFSEGKSEDAKRVMEDEDYRKMLYEEYGIEQG
jgi:hypothetical protein